MHLKTLLNSVHPIKGFVYDSVRSDTPGAPLQAVVRSRKNSRGICSACGQRGPTYDHRAPRRFGFVPLWAVAFVPAGEFRPGERLQTLTGEPRGLSATPRNTRELLYNLEIRGEHVYCVGSVAALVHNS